MFQTYREHKIILYRNNFFNDEHVMEALVQWLIIRTDNIIHYLQAELKQKS